MTRPHDHSLLFHNVQAWIAGRDFDKERAPIQQANDLQDIQELLSIATIVYKFWLEAQSCLPPLCFPQEAVDAIVQCAKQCPGTEDLWKCTGFDNTTPRLNQNTESLNNSVLKTAFTRTSILIDSNPVFYPSPRNAPQLTWSTWSHSFETPSYCPRCPWMWIPICVECSCEKCPIHEVLSRPRPT